MTQEMTSGERLWAALNGQEPDRVPIWMLYPRERLGYYVDVHNLPSYVRVMPHIWERTDWLDRRNNKKNANPGNAKEIVDKLEYCHDENKQILNRLDEKLNAIVGGVKTLLYRPRREGVTWNPLPWSWLTSAADSDTSTSPRRRCKR